MKFVRCLRLNNVCHVDLTSTSSRLTGSFVCEYIGELLTEPEGNRRMLLYMSRGTHPVYQFSGLQSLDGDRYSVDPLFFGSVSRFINHSCDANLQVSRSSGPNSADAL